jgi:hypothetical protein
VAGNEEGDDKGGTDDGAGDKEGNGNRWQQHGQWLWQRGLRVSNGSNNGNGDVDSTKDMATCAMTGERGVMVACVCFCVCGETTKIRLDQKKVNASWSL